MYTIASVVVILAIIILTGIFGCGPPSAPERATFGTDEWKEVKEAVDMMLTAPDPPIVNLYTDERIDWDNSANSATNITRNMTGSVSNKGELPLVGISRSGSGIMPVSHYLGKDQTMHSYWIDKAGKVHLAE